jgi:hypothetical protein
LLIQALLNPKYVGIFLFSKTIEFQVLGVEGKNNTFVGDYLIYNGELHNFHCS